MVRILIGLWSIWSYKSSTLNGELKQLLFVPFIFYVSWGLIHTYVLTIYWSPESLCRWMFVSAMNVFRHLQMIPLSSSLELGCCYPTLTSSLWVCGQSIPLGCGQSISNYTTRDSRPHVVDFVLILLYMFFVAQNSFDHLILNVIIKYYL